ncbi:hypothetical protein BCR33DRAFT_789375 [Rhizoclosmatium globosum]|uniref:Uncharacterized protein n=1 Tax=Rhizoclosmatium globosum TaxID=329046 RepID=A0A1Y2BT96_9FUNG|nr:hypothetical protein BCR33DRAFT_789375 [Rhizoclosmatium globosum]|eukprot:ORY37963.1 hypothetical protein BCR33DRAFT_789375 [Rhizoclosmatium globosum]
MAAAPPAPYLAPDFTTTRINGILLSPANVAFVDFVIAEAGIVNQANGPWLLANKQHAIQQHIHESIANNGAGADGTFSFMCIPQSGSIVPMAAFIQAQQQQPPIALAPPVPPAPPIAPPPIQQQPPLPPPPDLPTVGATSTTPPTQAEGKYPIGLEFAMGRTSSPRVNSGRSENVCINGWIGSDSLPCTHAGDKLPTLHSASMSKLDLLPVVVSDSNTVYWCPAVTHTQGLLFLLGTLLGAPILSSSAQLLSSHPCPAELNPATAVESPTSSIIADTSS